MFTRKEAEDFESKLLALCPSMGTEIRAYELDGRAGFGVRLSIAGVDSAFIYVHNGHEWFQIRVDGATPPRETGIYSSDLDSAVLASISLVGSIAKSQGLLRQLGEEGKLKARQGSYQACFEALELATKASFLTRKSKKWARWLLANLATLPFD